MTLSSAVEVGAGLAKAAGNLVRAAGTGFGMGSGAEAGADDDRAVRAAARSPQARFARKNRSNSTNAEEVLKCLMIGLLIGQKKRDRFAAMTPIYRKICVVNRHQFAVSGLFAHTHQTRISKIHRMIGVFLH